jgi:MFS family permease
VTGIGPARRLSPLRLGLGANAAQFTLLVLVNALVGAVAGLERTVLPLIAERDFALAAHAAVLSFILVFGVTKALANYWAGRLADRLDRKRVLVAGWLLATPVPFLLMWAPTWNWILAANALLGASQGLTWSMTVLMKLDLVGRDRRGLAMGLNESAGYLAVAASAWATGWIASVYGLRPEPFYLGLVFVGAGLAASLVLVRDTTPHVRLEAALHGEPHRAEAGGVFWRTTLKDRNLSSLTQAGLVNNLNDAMAWGLFPLVFARAGLQLTEVGLLAALYPATWGLTQTVTGALSDRAGRRPFIVGGMAVQAVAIVMVALSDDFRGFAAASVLLGLGTAAVYPTLLAGVADAAAPGWRGEAVGAYRFWRDSGYVFGAIIAGAGADLAGVNGALYLVAAMTLASGLIVAARLRRPPEGTAPLTV